MKKLLSLILCLILCLSLFACAANEEKSEKKTTSTGAGENSIKNNENESYSFTLERDGLEYIQIKSEYLSGEYRYPKFYEKMFLYVEELELQRAENDPLEEPAVTMKIRYYPAKSMSVFFVESGKKIGFLKFNSEQTEWYDVINTNIVKPLDLLMTIYTRINVVDGKLDFGDKVVTSFSLVNYAGPFSPKFDELEFKETRNFEQLMTFFKNIDLGESVTPMPPFEGDMTYRYFHFNFDDGSYSSISFLFDDYLNFGGGKCYELQKSQKNELYEMLRSPVWDRELN